MRSPEPPRRQPKTDKSGGKIGLDAGAARSKNRVPENLLGFRAIALSLAVCAAARWSAKTRPEI